MAQNQKQANGPAKPFSENDGEGAVKKWVWTPKLISVPSSWPYAWLWYHPHFRNNSQSLHFTHVLFTERNSENIMFVYFSFISFLTNLKILTTISNTKVKMAVSLLILLQFHFRQVTKYTVSFFLFNLALNKISTKF